MAHQKVQEVELLRRQLDQTLAHSDLMRGRIEHKPPQRQRRFAIEAVGAIADV